MDTKYCSGCYQKRPISSFLRDPSAGPNSRVLASCIRCRAAKEKYNKKRKALQQLDPNIPPKRRAIATTRPKPSIPPPNPRREPLFPLLNPPESRLETIIPPPNPPESRLETPIRVPTPPPTQPQTPGFLPADQWQFIQNFHTAMDRV